MRLRTLILPLIALTILSSSTLFGQITINEILADNAASLADGQGDFEDWIEIYNAGSSAVNLAGYYISDDPADAQLWQIPSTNASLTTVPANGYLLLWADKDTDDGENHINLKLGAGGETLTLTAANGSTVVDQVVFGAQNTDISYGRSVNGGGSFQLFTSPTPLSSNEVITIPTFASVVTRTVAQESDDCVEYGYSSQEVNIDPFGMIMTETWNTQKIGVRFQNIPIPSGATITGASIQFSCKDPTKSTGPSSLDIRAQKTDAATFQEINHNLSERPVTSAKVNWQPGEWLLKEFAGPAEKTADLSAIIQEVVDQGSWEAGNALAFVIEGSGQRSANNFTSGFPPTIEITYEAPVPTAPISNIFINEISANGTEYENEEGKTKDWIELYNDNNFPVSVGGLYMSDKASDLTKWQIGASTPIPAKGFLIIIADGDPFKGGFHADFKLSSNGETVSLVQAVGNDLVILDQIDYGIAPFKTSSGRSTEGANDWVLFGIQTPNAPNDGTLSWLESPIISLDNGVFTSAQSVTLSHVDAGATIRYTTDHSDPDNNSPIYNGPITVNETMAVKARAFKNGHAPSQISTKSYLFDASATLPVVMITMDPDDLYDDQTGIYVVGTNGIDVGFCSDNMPANYWQDWEKPATITFFDTDGEEKFDVNAGIKISGNCSRRNALKSLNIYLRSNTYGDGDIDYKLFPNRDFKKYERLRLRNSGQDYKHTMFRDGTNQQMLADVTDVEYQSYRPTLVYINGEYYGIQNWRDSYGDEYFDGLFDVKKEELDLVKNPRIENKIKEGDDVHYHLLYNYVLDNDLSDPAAFDYFTTQFDIENFIDYWITMTYMSSADWPANNLQVWRPRTADGKWRYMYLDTDNTTNIFGDGSTNGHEWDTFAEILNPNQVGWPFDSRATLFIRELLENQVFKDEFVQRTCSFMELILNEERAHSFINASAAVVDAEMSDHVEKWAFDHPYLVNYNDWLGKIDRYTRFFTERPSYFYDDMENHFDLDNQFELTFGYDASTNGEVLLHWKEMAIPFNYTGTYYTNMPIRIKAVADAGYEFLYWLETGNTNAEIDFEASGDRTLTPIFQAVGDVCNPASPDFQDADNDGVCDNDDQCPGFDDTVDTNNNGIPDGCDIACDDDDNDGVCNADDQCPGFDDNIDTNNNGIPDGCDIACDDDDNDGVCNVDDCEPNNPNLPAAPGTSCDDGDSNTTNDVILADECTCQGSPISTNPCDDIVVTATGGQITISGLGGAPHAGIQIFTSNWDRAFRCFADCEPQTQVVQLVEDTYYVKISLYDASYDEICALSEYYTVTNGGGPCSGAGGDADGDGICADDDCDDNDASLPATPGTSCDDGNSNTINDQIQSDGCSCQGTIQTGPCDNAGGDADGDGICAEDDCDDNDASLPAAQGTSCNDGNSNTINDQIQSDGCTCSGTPVNTGQYCDAQGNFPWHDWISNVSFNQINNASSKQSYSDFTNIVTPIAPGATYNITLETGFSWETFDEQWAVWIDFNQDYVFDNTELIFSGIANRPPNGTNNGSISGQATMPNYTPNQSMTRMRVAMSRGSTPTPCDTHPFGEVEDYSILLSSPNPQTRVSDNSNIELGLSPNPASDRVMVHLPNDFITQTLRVYTSNGILMNTIEDIPAGTKSFELNVSTLEKGVFFIHADFQGKQSRFAKLVILK